MQKTYYVDVGRKLPLFRKQRLKYIFSLKVHTVSNLHEVCSKEHKIHEVDSDSGIILDTSHCQ